MHTRTVFVFFVSSLLFFACSDDSSSEDVDPISASTRNELVWKRYWAVEQDLAAALEVPAEDLCRELGQASCVHEVHLVALGGHNPFTSGMYRPQPGPQATTPLALDRVVLSACVHRVDLDAAGPATVFTGLDLDGPAPAPESDAVRETAVELTRRLLARDPIDAELEILGELAVDDDGKPVSARDFAVSACYAVGTSTEFLFL